MRKKRTLAAYENLYRNPRALCPPGPDSQGAEVILYPNGEPEIWVKTSDGRLGFSVKFSEGKHGLSVNVRRFVGTPDLTTAAGIGAKPGWFADTEIGAVQYRPTAEAAAYREWYFSGGDYPAAAKES